MIDKRILLLKQLDERIRFFEKNSSKHKNFHRALRCTMIFATAILMILSALALKFEDHQENLNLSMMLVSTIAGIITSIDGLMKPGDLWTHERKAYYALFDLQRTVEFKTDDKSTPQEVEKYFVAMQEILGASGEKWNRFVQNPSQGLLVGSSDQSNKSPNGP